MPLHTSCISSCKLDEVGLNVVVGSSLGREEGEGEEGALLAVGPKVGSREGSNVGRNVDVGWGVGMALAVGAEVAEVGVPVGLFVPKPTPAEVGSLVVGFSVWMVGDNDAVGTGDQELVTEGDNVGEIGSQPPGLGGCSSIVLVRYSELWSGM